MISTLSWVPRGAARADPIRNELSAAELEMLVRQGQNMTLEEAQDMEAVVAATQADADFAEAGAPVPGDSDSDEEEDDNSPAAQATAAASAMAQQRGRGKGKKGKGKKSALPTALEDEDMTEEERKFMASLNLENYDEEEHGEQLMMGGKNLSVFENNSQDPYVTVPDDGEDSDEEDLVVREHDRMIVAGKTEDEQSSLEVYLYDESVGNLYVHHHVMLPSFPLCTQWVNFAPKESTLALSNADATKPVAALNNPESKEQAGNFLAVGTFEPQIEVWNLDVLDAIEPICTLGGRLPPKPVAAPAAAAGGAKGKKKKKKKKKGGLKAELLGELMPGSHSDAVMCMSWHPVHRGRLCSGSADQTIKLWDLSTTQCTTTMTHHQGKVQAVSWNPAEPSVLLSGAYDHTLALTDTRNPKSVSRYKVDTDVEAVCWYPLNPALFAASTEKGTVTCHDARKPGAALFTIGAHSKATSSVSFNFAAPNLLATASLDKSVKVWDTSNNKPVCIASKVMDIGPIYTMSWDKDSPSTIAAGGGKGKLAIWNTQGEKGLAGRFPKAPAVREEPAKKTTRTRSAARAEEADDDDDDDDDSDDSDDSDDDAEDIPEEDLSEEEEADEDADQ